MVNVLHKVAVYTPLLALLGWLFYLALRIWRFSFIAECHSADVAIVLGTAVANNQPSPVFAERINHGIQLYHDGTVDHLIFTGGYGHAQQLSEAAAAQQYAHERGVPLNQTAIETVSRFTHENIAQAEQIMQQRGWQKALVVSDPLHMRRAMTMAKHAGLNVSSAPTPTSRFRSWHSRGWFLLYETVCYAGYLLLRPLTQSRLAPSNGRSAPTKLDFSIFSTLIRVLTKERDLSK